METLLLKKVDLRQSIEMCENKQKWKKGRKRKKYKKMKEPQWKNLIPSKEDGSKRSKGNRVPLALNTAILHGGNFGAVADRNPSFDFLKVLLGERDFQNGIKQTVSGLGKRGSGTFLGSWRAGAWGPGGGEYAGARWSHPPRTPCGGRTGARSCTSPPATRGGVVHTKFRMLSKSRSKVR